MRSVIFGMIILCSTSCTSQERGGDDTQVVGMPIAQYVNDVFEDSQHHMWFATLNFGLARYDGDSLRYLTIADGLPSNRITAVIEDDEGILWIGSGDGLVRYDGKEFVQYSLGDGFSVNSISTLLIDSKERFWVGTWAGVYQFDGKDFVSWDIPYPEVTTLTNEDTKGWITELQEDHGGNIWIARDGYGVCKYDGEGFQHYLKKDGLHNNGITEVVVEENGSIWFGTRNTAMDHGDLETKVKSSGVNKWENGVIRSFPDIEALNATEVYELYQDRKQQIWIGTSTHGVYKWDGDEFGHYDIPISVTCMLEDQSGQLWLGGAGGLYRIDNSDQITHVTTLGPWK